MDVARVTYRNIALAESLCNRVDRFVANNEWGYQSRQQVLAQAVREFLAKRGDSEAQAEASATESKTESTKRQ